MKKTISLLFIALFAAGCGSKSDEDYLKMAAQSVKSQKITEAVAAYESLIKEFPESPLAPEAYFELGTLYQNQMVKDLSREKSLEKAAEYFRKIYQDYPASQEAPKALFMSGFIRANDLQNYDEATKIYNLFLEAYPEHELASAARQELDNMGLSPEEILKKKVADKL